MLMDDENNLIYIILLALGPGWINTSFVVSSDLSIHPIANTRESINYSILRYSYPIISGSQLESDI